MFYSILWALGGGAMFVKDLMYNSNEIFVELDAHLGNFNSGQEYVDKLSNFYNMNIAVVGDDGKILMKDSNIKIDVIDLDYIHEILMGQYKWGEFYQIYDLEIGQSNYKLVVWSSVKESIISRYNLVEEYGI